MSFRGLKIFENPLDNRFLLWVLVIGLLAIGIGIRLFDITDPTFQTRQLHGAVLARGMYYKMNPYADPQLRELAISFWKSTTQYEPPILERLAAYTYLIIGREEEWIGRLYSSIFWVAGGIGLFTLAQRMFAEIANSRALKIACLVGLGYYLISPFSVESSRDFQSDPGMVFWSILYLWALFVWVDRKSWKMTLLCGFLSGIAILVKITAVFILLPTFAAVLLYGSGWKRLWKFPQVWTILILMGAPTIIYMLSSRVQGNALTYFQNTTLALSGLLTKPSFYISWINFLQSLISLPMLLLGWIGLTLSPPRSRTVLISIWLGYVLYGAAFPHQIYTHDYYHLRMVPIVALCIVPAVSILLQDIDFNNQVNRIILSLLAIIAIGFPVWVSYSNFTKVDNRPQAIRWQEISARIPTDGKIVAMTQEYGFPLMFYGWRKVQLWPSLSEQELKALRGNPKKFEHLLEEYLQGNDYFLVTDMKQFQVQTDLRERLFGTYPLIIDEVDFLLFDLKPSSD